MPPSVYQAEDALRLANTTLLEPQLTQPDRQPVRKTSGLLAASNVEFEPWRLVGHQLDRNQRPKIPAGLSLTFFSNSVLSLQTTHQITL